MCSFQTAIIDRNTFEQVQVMLKGRALAYLHPGRVASRYLLSGLAKCGYCGKALVGQDAKGGKFKYYVCGTLLKKGAVTAGRPGTTHPATEAAAGTTGDQKARTAASIVR